MIILEHLGLAYMAVPKAACSSVKAALLLADPQHSCSEADVADHAFVHARLPTQRYQPYQWRTKTERLYRFTVIRDPIRRVLSAYVDRVVERKELRHSPKMRNQTELPLDPDPDTFFVNIKQYRELSSVVRHHTRTMRVFTGEKLDRYDRVYTTSELGVLAADLTRISGVEVRIPHVNKTQQRLTLDDLGAKAKAVLASDLAADYELYKAYFENPLAIARRRLRVA